MQHTNRDMLPEMDGGAYCKPQLLDASLKAQYGMEYLTVKNAYTIVVQDITCNRVTNSPTWQQVSLSP